MSERGGTSRGEKEVGGEGKWRRGSKLKNLVRGSPHPPLTNTCNFGEGIRNKQHYYYSTSTEGY